MYWRLSVWFQNDLEYLPHVDRAQVGCREYLGSGERGAKVLWKVRGSPKGWLLLCPLFVRYKHLRHMLSFCFGGANDYDHNL